jgi:hypothetical protein
MKRSLWICILLLAAASASALEVQQSRWGFDGQVVPGQFNLLSVLVANPSVEPFDGALNLYKRRGLEQRIGAIYVAPCYVSPLMTRWVQFYVYIENQYDQWRLDWGRASDDHHDLEPPRWGPPARVLVSDPDTPMTAGSAFKTFPEELFPPAAGATKGLDSLLLDHAPRWEPAKRVAFLNWLREGGTVHLLLGSDGKYPIFLDDLSVLNSPAERIRIGAGLVVRHAMTRQEIRENELADGGFPAPQFKKDEQVATYQATDSILRSLAMLSRPQHSWGLIHLLAFVYLFLIGPGNLLVGRRLADYRLRILLFVATVAGFAWLFGVVGRRGQGEASVIHTLSYARAINGREYNVTQWINVFATRGAQYTITHAAPHNLYATPSDYEPVNGQIQSGRDGRAIVDIPVFSRRALLHEAEMKGEDTSVKILNWEDAGYLKTLTLAVNSDFPKETMEIWALQGNRFYSMKRNKDRLDLADSTWQALSTALFATELHQFGPSIAYSGPDGDEGMDVETRFHKLAKPLLAWSLGGTSKDFAQYLASSAAKDGRVQLFIFARSPESFRVSGRQLGQEIGFVLYHVDLFRPES